PSSNVANVTQYGSLCTGLAPTCSTAAGPRRFAVFCSAWSRSPNVTLLPARRRKAITGKDREPKTAHQGHHGKHLETPFHSPAPRQASRAERLVTFARRTMASARLTHRRDQRPVHDHGGSPGWAVASQIRNH